ncbi:MAG: hypothetical protein HC882_01700 [Acidobacteria bacterium]|nr:hypothetical protein [Acidobacteriota bacterium]
MPTALAAVALGACGGASERTSGGSGAERLPISPVARIAARVRELLPQATIDESELRAFAEVYVAREADTTKPPIGHDLVTTFLMSTDYFTEPGGDRRSLRFLVLFDPYASPCYNPLADRSLG